MRLSFGRFQVNFILLFNGDLIENIWLIEIYDEDQEIAKSN